MKTKTTNPVGRPEFAPEMRKATYRIGLTSARYAELTNHFGSLANAVASIKIPKGYIKVFIGFALLCTLQSCSDYLCPAYSSYRIHNHRR